eukprot:CAMPEP_0202702694 /NCGR_PEP_ID=MMETSP1385-20130828/15639_1 /ASSEMBLY_ACC=CAM_ASM_000861 /TAXON_ID=933848 /ORGANISM="Elphidium margaritaceum" /LENGTH=463 /DNA_ID=CAMNT_0049360391 /DNA_START=973 /DNA_END=2364 /DNA_ORIENTATION=+
MAVESEKNVNEFIDQLLSAPWTDEDDIDMDELKTIITGKRKSCRNADAKKAGLEIGQRSNFAEIYANISQECKKSKQHNEETKDLCKQQKSEQRKHCKKAEKMIAEILQLKQEIANKQIDMQRLHSESTALQAQQQQQLNDNINTHYDIEQLLTEDACVQRIDEQYALLQTAMADTDTYEQSMQAQQSSNDAQRKQLDEIRKECHTYADAIGANDNCRKLRPFQQCLQSMQRLLRVQTLTMVDDCLRVEYESITQQIYIIQIRLEGGHQCRVHSVQITQNDTKYTDIADFVLRKLRTDDDDADAMKKKVLPFVWSTVHSLVSEIICILDRLPQRLADIQRLFDVYKGRQDIIPAFPESDQLVFSWKFKHGGGGGGGDEEQDEVTVTVPLVVTIGWQYPRPQGNDVITVQGHCCNVSESNRELETKWNEVVEETIQQVSGNFQSDIVKFVNFIHDKLQQFADSQ